MSIIQNGRGESRCAACFDAGCLAKSRNSDGSPTFEALICADGLIRYALASDLDEAVALAFPDAPLGPQERAPEAAY